MVTQATIDERVLGNFISAYPAERPFEEILVTPYTNVATTVSVPDGTQWTKGDILENWDTNELMQVTAVATNDLTVVRGYMGTSAAAGSAGERLRKNPRLTRLRIQEEINATLYDLRTHGVYDRDTTSFTLDQTAYIYSLDLGELVNPPGVISVYYVDPSTSVLVPIPFQLVGDVATGALAAGEGLRIHPGTWDASVTTAYVSKAITYSAVTALPDYLEGPVIDGATARCLAGFTGPQLADPGHLSNRTVQPGQGARDARFYQGQYILALRRISAMLQARDRRGLGVNSIQANRARRWVR